MKAKPHPEQGFHSCLGILSLVKSYGPERIEGAARRGNDIGATTYGSIKSILQGPVLRRRVEEPELQAAANSVDRPLAYSVRMGLQLGRKRFEEGPRCAGIRSPRRRLKSRSSDVSGRGTARKILTGPAGRSGRMRIRPMGHLGMILHLGVAGIRISTEEDRFRGLRQFRAENLPRSSRIFLIIPAGDRFRAIYGRRNSHHPRGGGASQDQREDCLQVGR
jgi:hypothetical protein